MKFALALAVVLSGCTHLVWYGRSDDRRHVASVIEVSGRQHVRFDSVDGPPTRGVGIDGLVLGPDAHLTYPAELEDGWVVFHDGVPGAKWKAIGGVVVRGEHVAYAAQRGDQWFVVVDEQPSEPWTSILSGSLVLHENGRWAYVAERERQTVVVIDGVASKPVDAAGQLRFSNDGRRLGFVARVGDVSEVRVGTDVMGPFQDVVQLELDPEAAFLARREGAWHCFGEGREGPPFEQVAGLLPGDTVACVGKSKGQQWVLDGDRVLGPFKSLTAPLQRDATGRLIVAAKDEGGELVLLGADRRFEVDVTEPPVVAGEHVGFIGARAGRSLVMIDGVQRAEWDWAGSLALGSFEGRYAYLARNGKQQWLVVDGVATAIEMGVSGSLAFSKDGRRFGCVLGERARRRLYFSLEGARPRTVDLEELVAALTRSGALATQELLLRRWVEAELELR